MDCPIFCPNCMYIIDSFAMVWFICLYNLIILWIVLSLGSTCSPRHLGDRGDDEDDGSIKKTKEAIDFCLRFCLETMY